MPGNLPGTRLLLGVLFTLSACGPSIVERHMNLAEQYLRQGHYTKAIEEYTRVANFAKSDPLAIRAHENIASIYRTHLREPQRAVRSYRGIVMMTSDTVKKKDAMLAIASIYIDDLNNPTQGASEYQYVYEKLPLTQDETAKILLLWADALTEASQFMAAVARYREFIVKFPEHVDIMKARIGLGQGLLAANEIDEAEKGFKEIIDVLSNTDKKRASLGEAYYGLGNVFEYREDFNKALEAYGKSLEWYPNRDVVEMKIRGLRQRFKATGK
ncbi:MAG TPA: tetratricopeptide repeat protein [Bdellovibrionota bacterium]|nr:tetratricopeptide repeat protein [Bdellovibrionota bacterium]